VAANWRAKLLVRGGPVFPGRRDQGAPQQQEPWRRKPRAARAARPARDAGACHRLTAPQPQARAPGDRCLRLATEREGGERRVWGTRGSAHTHTVGACISGPPPQTLPAHASQPPPPWGPGIPVSPPPSAPPPPSRKRQLRLKRPRVRRRWPPRATGTATQSAGLPGGRLQLSGPPATIRAPEAPTSSAPHPPPAVKRACNSVPLASRCDSTARRKRSPRPKRPRSAGVGLQERLARPPSLPAGGRLQISGRQGPPERATRAARNLRCGQRWTAPRRPPNRGMHGLQACNPPDPLFSHSLAHFSRFGVLRGALSLRMGERASAKEVRRRDSIAGLRGLQMCSSKQFMVQICTKINSENWEARI
jgi:hypothetical protein